MMNKINKFLDNPKNKIILWILTGIIIFLVAVLSPKADTYDVTQFSAQLYDNVNGSLSSVTTSYDSSMEIYYGYVSWSGSNASGGAWGISSPIPLIANHTYSMTASVSINGCGTTALSSYNRIGVGTTLSGAVSSYQGNSYVNENYSRAVAPSTLQFVFTPTINGSYIVFPFASSSSCNGPATHLNEIIIDDLGSGGVSETTINNSLNNQTNIINSSISSAEFNITNSIQQTEENINSTIEDTFTTCKEPTNMLSDLSGIISSSSLFTSSVSNNILTISPKSSGSSADIASHYDFTNLKPNTDYTFTFTKTTNNLSLKTYIYHNSMSGANIILNSDSTSITFNTGNYSKIIIGFYISGNYTTSSYVKLSNVSLTAPGVCTNKLDDLNDSVNNVNDTLNDETPPTTPDFSDLDVADDTVISDLVTMPITIAQHILDAFSDTCSNYTIPFFNNTSLTLPCFTISDYVGNDVAGIIDLAIILFMIYNIGMLAVSIFNDLTSLRDSYDSLYVPQHGPHSYEPRHAKE